MVHFQRHARPATVMARVVVALEDRKPFGLAELASENGGADLHVAHALELPEKGPGGAQLLEEAVEPPLRVHELRDDADQDLLDLVFEHLIARRCSMCRLMA